MHSSMWAIMRANIASVNTMKKRLFKNIKKNCIYGKLNKNV